MILSKSEIEGLPEHLRKLFVRLPDPVSDEVLAGFPRTKSGANAIKRASGADRDGNTGPALGAESRAAGTPMIFYGDEGSAARFFYQAKANKKDRAGSKHPTVKPIALMRYLCRLVTPLGGTILDPFAGSGTTAEAAYLEGFHCILMERETQYLADIRRRLEVLDEPYPVPLVPTQTTLDLD